MACRFFWVALLVLAILRGALSQLLEPQSLLPVSLARVARSRRNFDYDETVIRDLAAARDWRRGFRGTLRNPIGGLFDVDHGEGRGYFGGPYGINHVLRRKFAAARRLPHLNRGWFVASSTFNTIPVPSPWRATRLTDLEDANQIRPEEVDVDQIGSSSPQARVSREDATGPAVFDYRLDQPIARFERREENIASLQVQPRRLAAEPEDVEGPLRRDHISGDDRTRARDRESDIDDEDGDY